MKELAQSKESQNNKLAQFSIGDHLFEVKDRGRSVYKYILRDHWYQIQISGPYTGHTPLAYVQLSSEALTFEGPYAMEEDLRGVVSSLGIISGDATVSRVDLCVDLITDTDIEQILERAWVTRARTFNYYSDQRRFSGLTIGLGGDISARLYNKTIELEKSGKEYLKDIWADLGWQSGQQVWRLEFQLKRNTLRQLNIRTFSEFMDRLGSVWQYATSEWLRLTCPDPTDKTKGRWPIHHMWEELQNADWGTEQSCNRQSTPKGQPPSDRSLFVNGLSGLTSFMARESILDVDEGEPAFFRAAEHYHNDRAHFTGLPYDLYVEQKVRLKAKRYNSIHNQPPGDTLHPADEAVAKEYRRRSDGE